MNVSVSQLRGFRTILFYTGTNTGTKQFAALTRLFYTIKERKKSNEEVKS